MTANPYSLATNNRERMLVRCSAIGQSACGGVFVRMTKGNGGAAVGRGIVLAYVTELTCNSHAALMRSERAMKSHVQERMLIEVI